MNKTDKALIVAKEVFDAEQRVAEAKQVLDQAEAVLTSARLKFEEAMEDSGTAVVPSIPSSSEVSPSKRVLTFMQRSPRQIWRPSQIAAALVLNPQSVRNALYSMAQSGKMVRRTAHGRYKLRSGAIKE